MELLTPGYGLIFWQIIVMLSSLLFVVSWVMILIDKRLDATERLTWMLGTLLLPIIGAVIYFVKRSRVKARQA
jgi:hypothetical protein